MEPNTQDNRKLTKQERKELRRQEKAQEALMRNRSLNAQSWTKRLVIALFVAGSVGGIFWYNSTRPTVPTIAPLVVVEDDWIKGNKEASVTLIEYLDFECEACGAYYPVIKRLSEEFKNEVRFVNRYFPLPGHKNSQTAARAVEAAGKQGKYWEMYDIVFENQSSWGEKQAPDPAIFEGYTQQLGLDLAKFRRDVASQEVKDRIERDRSAGVKLNIQGTPTFFLNGEKIQNPRGYEDFKKLIQSAISETTKESGKSSTQITPTI